jgi:predicted metalloprotease
MTKNGKIALGCGVAGCLGLILIVIVVVVLGVLGYVAIPGIANSNSNYNSNDNYNSNSNLNSNTNSNSDTNANANTNSGSSSSMTDDDKHKLYQAAGVTRDNELIMRVIRKIGLGDGLGEDHQEFVKEHFKWAMKNLSFVQSVNNPEAARAYVDAHIDD